MSITAPTLTQAREALVSFSQQKAILLSQLAEQSQKIADLESEVQKQATLVSQATSALAAAKIEIESLRSQIPDEATVKAFDSLVSYLSAPTPAWTKSEMRIAA